MLTFTKINQAGHGFILVSWFRDDGKRKPGVRGTFGAPRPKSFEFRIPWLSPRRFPLRVTEDTV